MTPKTVFGTLAALLIFFGLGWGASEAGAAEAKVRVEVNRKYADVGVSGFDAYALIHVVVTKKGKPVSNLGETMGDGDSVIDLPSGWTLRTLSVPADGGCVLVPTRFVNVGNGIYTIQVVTMVSDTGCAWIEGDYVFSLQIDKKRRRGVSTGVINLP